MNYRCAIDEVRAAAGVSRFAGDPYDRGMFENGEWHVAAWLTLVLAVCFQVSSWVYFDRPVEPFAVILFLISIGCFLVLAQRHVRATRPPVTRRLDDEDR